MNDKWYFAYGSNLKKERLNKRIGFLKDTQRAILVNYELTFAKGYDGHISGKADVRQKHGSFVKGAVYLVSEEQLDSLDGPEGVTMGVYERKSITVEINGNPTPAVMYVMKKEICPLKPSEEYLSFILEGLGEHGYDESVINEVRMLADMFRNDEKFLGSQEIFSQIRKLLNKTTYVKIAVAFLTKDGFDEISAKIEEFLQNKSTNKIDFIVGLSSYCITDPDAVKALMKLQASFLGQAKVKYYYNEGFHPKLFIFENENETTCIVGSSNLTWQGLNSNVEANVMFRRPNSSALTLSIQDFFKNLMDYAASDLAAAFRQYDRIYEKSNNQQKGQDKSGDETFYRTPLPPQFFEPKNTFKNFYRIAKFFGRLPLENMEMSGTNGIVQTV